MTSDPTTRADQEREADTLFDIRGLEKSYGAFHAVRGIDLSVRQGNVLVLIGPSGCGKSTVLRCLNLLENWDAGTMRFEDRTTTFGPRLPGLSADAVSRHRAQVGMVFQQFHLFPHMSVLDNVMAGPRIVQHMPAKQAAELAHELLAKVKLADKAALYPKALSGGQAQRVAIARALAMRPKMMLFDEATSALDPELVGEVLEVIQTLAREGTTMILVTHEMHFAKQVADEIYFMDEGRIVEHGLPAQVLDHPESERLKSFLSRFREQFG